MSAAFQPYEIVGHDGDKDEANRIKRGLPLSPSDTTSICPWKGTASYYHLQVNGAENRDAVWSYADPKPTAAEIKGRAAFWKGVEGRYSALHWRLRTGLA